MDLEISITPCTTTITTATPTKQRAAVRTDPTARLVEAAKSPGKRPAMLGMLHQNLLGRFQMERDTKSYSSSSPHRPRSWDSGLEVDLLDLPREVTWKVRNRDA